MSTRILALTAVSLLGATGCEQRCGEGTIERDGVCVPAESNPDEANCGEGTVLGDDGKCVSELDPTLCDPDTTLQDTSSIPGVILCVGNVVASCDASLPCPGADADRVTVCGRLYDTQTNDEIRAATPNILDCDDGGAPDGPCALRIRFFDALRFANDPKDALAEVTPQNFRQDDCGRYVAENIPVPTLGFLGIGVDGQPGNTDYALTGVAFAAASEQVFNRQVTYATRFATDDDWSADVGAITQSLVEQGLFMSIFLHGSTPVAGVRVIDTATGPRPNDDYYFNDPDPSTRDQADLDGPNNDNRTGPNGVALLVGSALTDHTGEGAEPPGCEWPEDFAKGIPNVIFVNPRVAHVIGDADTPCPP